MKTKLLWTTTLILAAILHMPVKGQAKRGVAQATATMPPPPPPPPGPPPDFIDDDTEFDDGDDLPENYMPPRPQAGMPGMNGGQMPYAPPPATNQGGAIPSAPLNPQAPRQVPFPPAQQPISAMPSYENDRPRFNGSKLHFKVVKDEFFEKGKKRERGKIDQQ